MTLTNSPVEGFFPIPLVRDVPLLPPFLRRARPSLPPFLNSLRPFFVVLGGQTSLAMASEDWVPLKPLLEALPRLLAMPLGKKKSDPTCLLGLCHSLPGSKWRQPGRGRSRRKRKRKKRPAVPAEPAASASEAEGCRIAQIQIANQIAVGMMAT